MGKPSKSGWQSRSQSSTAWLEASQSTSNLRHARTRGYAHSDIMPVPKRPKTIEGRFDVRHAAAAFAPIVGAFSALAVTAIIVLFTVPPRPSPYRAPFVALAAGLLVIAMISSFAGSFGLAAIGAEEDSTANLVPAMMYMHASVMISLVLVLAAFEVLAAIYLPESKTLLALITATGGLFGSLRCSFGVSDAWGAGPSDVQERKKWIETQWIKSHEQAYRWTSLVMLISAIPIVLGVVLRLLGVGEVPTTASVNWLLGIGFVLAMTANIMGLFRSRHRVDRKQRGLRQREGITIPLSIGLYILGLMIFLP